MRDTTIDALKNLYLTKGGSADDFANITVIPDAINTIALAEGGDVTVEAAPAETDFWGTTASQMQTSVAVSGRAITGTLTKLTSGSLVDVWGAGYFIGLKFTKTNAKVDTVKVAMNPSVSSGLVALEDDGLAVFKVTDKNAQTLICVSYEGDLQYTQTYDVSGLTLSE